MKANWRGRTTGVMTPWAHVAFWFLGALLALLAGITGLAALGAFASGEPAPDPRNALYLTASGIALVLLALVWRRFWFLASDLVALVESHGGAIVEGRRAARRAIRARVNDLWLIATLDRPVLSYWPARQVKISRRGFEPRGGLRPQYMLSAARVDLVRVGDFTRLPQVTLQVTRESLLQAPSAAGDPALDAALGQAAGALTASAGPLTIEIRDRWLRVSVPGGSWLGAAFGRRIADAIAFTERLLSALSSRFTPADPDAWNVESEGHAVRVEPARERSGRPMRLKAIMLGLLVFLLHLLVFPSILHAGTQEAGGAFLISARDADGGWSSRVARRPHATAEALRALQALRADPIVRAAAADLLQSMPVADADDRARRLVALVGEGRDVAVALSLLLAEADARGGWPLAPFFEPDALDTALALQALAAAAAPASAALGGGLGLLVAEQNVDGGWPCVAGGASDVSCTAEALLALSPYRDRFFIDRTLTAARGFLRAVLNADGSFGASGPDHIYTTALAARALVASGDDLGASRLTTISFLHLRQGEDGAWDGDPLITAVALLALDALLGVPVCGDGMINLPGEACDRLDLRGQTCEGLGLGAGTLACSSACTFDTAGCSAPPACGDGVRNQSSELCDGADLGAATCQSVGFLGGSLGCNADCTFDASACTGVPACGDGIVNRPEEQCDRGDLAGASCASLGLLAGTLSCSPSCEFNTTSCTGTGETEPRSITIGPDSAVCSAGTETRPISIRFPPAAVVDKVDVFFLFDDTGSFAGRVPTVRNIFNALVTELQTALPGISLAFGVGRFEDYGGPGTGFSAENTTGRPFTLNQPIVTPDVAEFPTLISNALNRTAPGFGGDLPETSFEALFQVATGAGFDGNGNGSTLDSGPAGKSSGTPNPQTVPGASGDVPAFASNVAPASGTLGGVGFRPRALHLVVMAGDVCSVAPHAAGEPIPGTIAGAGGSSVPASALHCSNLVGSRRFGYVSNSVSRSTNTVAGAIAPLGSATVPATISALNALGISVIGLADAGTPIRNPVGPSTLPSTYMSALALLTGATDATGLPLVFNISGGTTPLKNAIVQAITTAATRPVTVSTRAVGVPADVTASLSPNAVPNVGPGGQASFDLTLTGSGVPRGGFVVEFFDTSSNAVLGAIPVTLACLPLIERPPDQDGDGFRADADCADQNAAVNPGATEIPGNGIDDDCNPATPDAVSAGDLTCTVTADKVSYGAQEEIRLDVLLTRAGGTASLVGLQLALNVTHSAGATLGDALETLAPLGPGERRLRSFFFTTGTAAPGELSALAQVMSGTAAIASCSAAASIVETTEAGVGLIGTIQADPPVAFFRDPVLLRYTARNAGNVPLDPTVLEILIVDAVSEQVAARLNDSTSLGVGGAFEAAQPAPGELPVGEYVVVLRGGGGNDLTTLASAPLSIRVPPNLPPVCDAATASLPMLWPPNHKFALVGVQGVTDPDADPLTIRILGVTQNEGVLENGTGNTCPDAIIGTDSVQIRAERAGGGTGRVYRIRFEAADAAGATCTGQVRVCVPHDQSGRDCIEGSRVEDATVCPAEKK